MGYNPPRYGGQHFACGAVVERKESVCGLYAGLRSGGVVLALFWIGLMRVRELIEQLERYCDKESLVVLSRDAEGNGFKPLSGLGLNNRYKNGDVGLDHLTHELEARGYCEEDVVDGGERCVVLWPE